MNERHVVKIAEELKVRPEQVKATGALLEDGATMPFIARYRKEATASGARGLSSQSIPVFARAETTPL